MPGLSHPSFPDPPTHADVFRRLREALGPESSVENGVARWWVSGRAGGKGLAIWLRPGDPTAEICEVWITRPYHEHPECCPITSHSHLEALIQRVQAAAQPDASPDVRGLCPPGAA